MGCADNKDDFSGSTATPMSQPCSSFSFLSFQQRSSADSTHVALEAYRHFWTNILHLIRHVFLNRNFFRHPSILAMEKAVALILVQAQPLVYYSVWLWNRRSVSMRILLIV